MLLLLTISCLEPYQPALDHRPIDYLVINGFVNATEGSASVKLSHAVSISDAGAPLPELKATVSIEENSGASFDLTEQDSGRYRAQGLTIKKDAFYTLLVRTKSGKKYLSEPILILDTPPIDSLSFSISNDGNGLTILVDTHDPFGKTRFYAWDYIETYEYRTPFYSGYKRVNKIPVPRKADELIDRCWRTLPSTTILTSSSKGLREDIIHHFRLTTIPKNSQKITVRYSILVKQMALSESEFEYLEQLRKTTENLGSLFGIQPSVVVGNIHQADDPTASVLGYFGGAQVTEKRFFIGQLDMPEDFRIPFDTEGCVADTTCNPTAPPPSLSICVPVEELAPTHEILYDIRNMSGDIIGYVWSLARCADCRLKGGVARKPDFW